MRVLTPGHQYSLADYEDGDDPQFLQFIHKELHPETQQFETVTNGTTNEEVLKVLIDRIRYLNTKAPCRENSIVLMHLETALLWLDKRTADRKNRGVEGTPTT
jgi:hypothetical protein